MRVDIWRECHAYTAQPTSDRAALAPLKRSIRFCSVKAICSVRSEASLRGWEECQDGGKSEDQTELTWNNERRELHLKCDTVISSDQ